MSGNMGTGIGKRPKKIPWSCIRYLLVTDVLFLISNQKQTYKKIQGSGVLLLQGRNGNWDDTFRSLRIMIDTYGIDIIIWVR